MSNVDDNIKETQHKNLYVLWRKYLPKKLINSLDKIQRNSSTNETIETIETIETTETTESIKSAEMNETNEANETNENYADNRNYNENGKKKDAKVNMETFVMQKLKNIKKQQVKANDENTEEEIDGFVLVKDPNEKKAKTLKWRLRKYFVQNIAMEEEKYREGDDIMIENGYVFVDTQEGVNGRTADEDFILGLIDFTAGSFGGFVQVIVSQPFDTIKVKQQMFPKLYKRMIKSLKIILRTDGLVRGLYAGTKPALLASIAENSVLFAAYGRCQNLITNTMEIKDVKDLSVLGYAAAGFLTAFFSTFTLCPMELVKCKLQAKSEAKPFVSKVGKARSLNAWQVTKGIIETDGIAGLYRGLTSTFTREMPGLFFFFGGYEGTRTFFTKPGQTKDDIGSLRTMLAGMIGGISLWITTYPIDVIKTRIQVNNLQKSMFTVAWSIITKEGFLTLYKGLLPSVIRTIPASAALFWVYEYSKKLMTQAAGFE